MKDYYVAINLIEKEAVICTTKAGTARFLNISVDTIDRRMKDTNYSMKENKWIVFKNINISKSNNKGNINNLVKH